MMPALSLLSNEYYLLHLFCRCGDGFLVSIYALLTTLHRYFTGTYCSFINTGTVVSSHRQFNTAIFNKRGGY